MGTTLEHALDHAAPGRLPAARGHRERPMKVALPAAADLDGFLAGVERQAYRMARYGVRDDDQALDIVQDSMLRLVEHYAARPAEEWPALFFTILHNRIRDAHRGGLLRDGTRRVVSLFGFGGGGEDEEFDPLERGPIALRTADHSRPEERIEAQRLRSAIEQALARLPERQRQVYLLRECQELSVRETSQVLGCSEGAVKQHHFRAMQALRKLLAEVWNDERTHA